MAATLCGGKAAVAADSATTSNQRSDPSVEQSAGKSSRLEQSLFHAGNGASWAQSIVGVAYYTGDGVARDFDRARYWFGLAAAQDFAEAQYNLGIMFDRGNGVEKDHRIAAEWFQRAADQGFVAAQFQLGNLYYRGAGVPRNASTAARWWRVAAENGLTNAQGNLGAVYFDGDGVEQDFLECYAWSSLAVAGGHEGSLHNRDLCAEKIPAESQPFAEQKAAEYTMWFGNGSG